MSCTVEYISQVSLIYSLLNFSTASLKKCMEDAFAPMLYHISMVQ